mmetsp:Transcript_77234/g.208497  ORF Transcript_77234/g.208497 Transcript_77234/m.208497 type:complete len:174 (-) Transcript_77234:28-549(-)
MAYNPSQKELAEIKRQMEPLESDKRRYEREQREIDEQLAIDFTPDGAYLALHNKCFSTPIQQYTYEVCMFDKALQKEGHSSQNLGTFTRWEEEPGAGPHSVMIYSGGGSCWNGRSRSMRVRLLCGDEEYVVSVQEPSRCEYHMEFMTPLACSQEAADRLRRDLDVMMGGAAAA